MDTPLFGILAPFGHYFLVSKKQGKSDHCELLVG